jgi:hypothetical protein
LGNVSSTMRAAARFAGCGDRNLGKRAAEAPTAVRSSHVKPLHLGRVRIEDAHGDAAGGRIGEKQAVFPGQRGELALKVSEAARLVHHAGVFGEELAYPIHLGRAGGFDQLRHILFPHAAAPAQGRL